MSSPKINYTIDYLKNHLSLGGLAIAAIEESEIDIKDFYNESEWDEMGVERRNLIVRDFMLVVVDSYIQAEYRSDRTKSTRSTRSPKID